MRRCWVDKEALDNLHAEAAKWRFRETGGALLGWSEGDQFVVAKVLGPGPKARHGCRFFEPDATWQQGEGERIYRESGRRVAYIGEWHTHPLGAPTPSELDRETAQMIAEEPDFRSPRPLSAIVGRRWVDHLRGARPTLVVYVWAEDRFEEMALERCRVDRLLGT
jgi:integrative and conjugative element protein (TIGR02256 family)